MEGKSVVEDIKYEEGQTNLTEAQIQSIANEALNETKAKKEDEWKPPVDAEVEAQAAKEKEEADQKAKEAAAKAPEPTAEQIKAKEEEDAKAKKIADDKEAEEKAKAVKDGTSKEPVKDDKPFSIPPENRSKLVEELALKESLTLEEAEIQIAKDEAIVNKYKKDPVEMARALRHIQRESDKAKSELEAVKKAGNTPPAPVLNNVRDYVESQLAPIKDKVIDAYRKEYPELSEGQEDNYIYGLVKKDAIDRSVKVLEENKAKLDSAAKEKRANLIMNLSDTDKAFLPDIKAILDRTNAAQIMAKEYDIKDIIHWAKGKQIDRLVKEAEERGYKRGIEQPKIIGEKTPGAGNKQAGGNESAKKTVLSSVQQQRALDMFDSVLGMSDQDKFDAYVETYPEEFKK